MDWFKPNGKAMVTFNTERLTGKGKNWALTCKQSYRSKLQNSPYFAKVKGKVCSEGSETWERRRKLFSRVFEVSTHIPRNYKAGASRLVKPILRKGNDFFAVYTTRFMAKNVRSRLR